MKNSVLRIDRKVLDGIVPRENEPVATKGEATMSFRVCLFVAAAATLIAGSSVMAATITPFVTQSGGTPRGDAFPQAGFGFYADPSGTVQINQLGYWDEGNDGLAVAHDVGVYHFSAGVITLLAKATIPAGTGALLENGYRWASIPTLTLTDTTQGADYYQLIASQGPGPDIWYDGGVVAVTPSIGTVTGNGFYTAAPMGPVGSTATFGVFSAFGGPNMGFAIPEPSSVVLLTLGAVMVGLIKVRSRKS
jgi:hypothetical protein